MGRGTEDTGYGTEDTDRDIWDIGLMICAGIFGIWAGG